MVGPPKKERLNVVDPHVSGNNVVQCVGDPQMMEMKATNSP